MPSGFTTTVPRCGGCTSAPATVSGSPLGSRSLPSTLIVAWPPTVLAASFVATGGWLTPTCTVAVLLAGVGSMDAPATEAVARAGSAAPSRTARTVTVTVAPTDIAPIAQVSVLPDSEQVPAEALAVMPVVPAGRA